MRPANVLSMSSAIRGLLFLVLLLIPSNILAFSFSGWFHGASGCDYNMINIYDDINELEKTLSK